MFYAKTQLTEDTAITIELTGENVFNRCPGCGTEVPVNLDDIIGSDGMIDLYHTAVFCGDCENNAIEMRDRMNGVRPAEGWC